MLERPLSVTIAGWVVMLPVAMMLIALFHALVSRHRAELIARWAAIPGRFFWPLMLAWAAGAVVLGSAILSGRDWGRIGLFLWCGYVVLRGVCTKKPARVIVARIAAAALFALLLLNPEANRYFGGSYF